MFDRIISVDWSGAGSEIDGVDLRIAIFDPTTNQSVIVDRPYQKRTVVSWSRRAFRSWIVEQLQNKRPTLVAMDFGYGLPWGADNAVFGVTGWRDMIRVLAEKYEENRTARATAQAINDKEQFSGHGPYRFDDNRNDFRFYLDKGIAYYRLTELIAPQGISQWYLGSGGTVGFHTISGLSAINFLIREREAGRLDFVVWPHESLSPDGTKHVLVESYPAVCNCPGDYGPCRENDQNQRDAWKVLQMLIKKRTEGTLARLFKIKEQPFGRITGVEFNKQIQFEGFILGLTEGEQ
jgi:hypothetical protein